MYNKFNKTNMLSVKNINEREFTKVTEYPVHLLICLGQLEVLITLSDFKICVRLILSQDHCVVIVSLALL